MNMPHLTDDEFEEIKHYWENNHNRYAAAVMADTLLKDVDRLIVTAEFWKENYEDALKQQIVSDEVCSLHEEIAKLQEQIDINTPHEALIQLQGEMAELKDIHQREISKKNGVIECLEEKNRKLEDENDRLTGTTVNREAWLKSFLHRLSLYSIHGSRW